MKRYIRGANELQVTQTTKGTEPNNSGRDPFPSPINQVWVYTVLPCTQVSFTLRQLPKSPSPQEFKYGPPSKAQLNWVGSIQKYLVSISAMYIGSDSISLTSLIKSSELKLYTCTLEKQCKRCISSCLLTLIQVLVWSSPLDWASQRGK